MLGRNEMTQQICHASNNRTSERFDLVPVAFHARHRSIDLLISIATQEGMKLCRTLPSTPDTMSIPRKPA